MPEIVSAAIDRIANNPYRRLHAYPFIESKLKALQHSIEDVGLWPSIMARPLKEKLWDYELAFGHHRLEAARRNKIKEIALIADDLSDLQMLQYMGRENLEDYDSSFLIQLESWEAAIKSNLLPERSGKNAQALDIAKLLGWTEVSHPEREEDSGLQLNNTARACAAAYALIEGGYQTREIYQQHNVRTARDLAESQLRINSQIDEQMRRTQRSLKDGEDAKRQATRGARRTASQLREGSIKPRDVRAHVQFNTMGESGSRPSPLLSAVANDLATRLSRHLQSDVDAQKLAQMVEQLSMIEMLEDWEALSRVRLELGNLAKRAEGWERRLLPSQEKVVHFRALEGAKA